MTAGPLPRLIARLIAETGPMPLDHYMAMALGHPKHGYYMTRDPLGALGDFTTAPEISQMFGELLGLWLADAWTRQGAPTPFVLAELGPGRGTLMADLLRALRAVPPMLEAAEVHFVETSPVLKAAQQEQVPQATWHDRIDTLPPQPLFLIANEFFDALPIRQFVKTDRGWCERHIALGEGSTEDNPRFVSVLSPVPLPSDDILPKAARSAPIGGIAEISPASLAYADEIATRIRDHGGAALIVDYGHVKSAAGDTLQAVRGHQFASPFEAPGEADITAHVDFEALGLVARRAGVNVHGPVEQGEFLRDLGIDTRAKKLKTQANEEQAREIDAALKRLTARNEMGSLFKAVALTPQDAPEPAGF
ncbi:MAG: SAM-dependent methyltransferase [Parvibaculum sp.]|uniref:class I SAM-dependent methyltransferase n=1 Tax=Parvibaculum sp. TaxID=2024848 RepID=UPI00284E51E7|nr:SAM-dependent methyltransferase [Parvibaculum sp.]MDR3499669.1 SAM-dependent methyltransferase [Parvibaculum sp.]